MKNFSNKDAQKSHLERQPYFRGIRKKVSQSRKQQDIITIS